MAGARKTLVGTVGHVGGQWLGHKYPGVRFRASRWADRNSFSRALNHEVVIFSERCVESPSKSNSIHQLPSSYLLAHLYHAAGRSRIPEHETGVHGKLHPRNNKI